MGNLKDFATNAKVIAFISFFLLHLLAFNGKIHTCNLNFI